MVTTDLSSSSKLELAPGDILYSSKGWSTFLVGHVAIVGPRLNIHHSHPKGGFSETVDRYLTRHKFGGTMTILRPRKGALEAADWAARNIEQVTSYLFHPRLDTIHHNYCSKFIWQAFWYASNIDMTSRKLAAHKQNWVYPYNIKHSWLLTEKAQINIGEMIENLKI